MISNLGYVLAAVGIVAVGASLVETMPWIEALDLGWRVVVLSSTVALLAAIVLVPIAVAMDRSVSAFRRYIEDAASGEPPSTFGGPKWLLSINRSFIGAVDQFHQRERALRSQVRDLEVRHRVAEAERRQIEAVLHSLRDPVIVTDGFNEIVMANQAAGRLLGFDSAEALHKPVESVFDDPELCRMIADVRANAGVHDRRHVEHTLTVQPGMTESGGTSAVFELVFSCVENHKGEVAGVVTILHDLTRERELSQMKSDFVSKASHELRTPLSSIRAYVEMLVDGEAQDEETRDEFCRIIQNETERLGRLIDNMLNISRIEAGIIQVEREPVDIRTLIARAASTIEPQARAKSITIGTRLSEVDLCVDGDGDMLYQVVLNLVSNAVKYTPEGGRITITADSDNLTRSVVVGIADTGLGIPPDALPRIFEKFFRVENYKRVAKGTGLGLSLCKHIVETVHNGTIGVDSELGMGSKFWFTIPMQYAGSQRAA